MRRTGCAVAASNKALGGEHHETCFCTCRSRRTWRRCTDYRVCVRDALHHSRSGLASVQHRTGGLRLQRMGPLLAPAGLWRRLLPSALLWRMGLAPLASLAPVVIRKKGASAPFFFGTLGCSRHCCFSQNDSRPCPAEPPITQGM